MKTIEEAIQASSRCLNAVGIENPRLESEFLVAACLDIPRAQLILRRSSRLSPQKIRMLQKWLRERQLRKPLAYLTGLQPFRDLEILVSPAVLIPRPETELVVEQAMRVLDRFTRQAVAIDVGTGSGAIALSLAAHPRIGRMIGIDISADALRMARRNARQSPYPRVEWLRGDLLRPLVRRRVQADLIIANLPYVRTADYSALEEELLWEPRLALDGGTDGLRLIEPCVIQSQEVLQDGGILLLEIGADQGPATCHLLQAQEAWSDIQVFRDLAGLPRIVQAVRSATVSLADPPGRSGGKGD